MHSCQASTPGLVDGRPCSVARHTLLGYEWEGAVPDEIGLPAYRRVADDLRAQIGAGRLSVGDPIPSTTRLCDTYGVSATVVRAAVVELRNEGLVQGQPGKAVYVIATPEAVGRNRVQLEDVSAEVVDMRRTVAELSERLDDAARRQDVDEVRSAVNELRRQLGDLQSQLIELYSRTGHDYPRPSGRTGKDEGRREAQ